MRYRKEEIQKHYDILDQIERDIAYFKDLEIRMFRALSVPIHRWTSWDIEKNI